MRFLASLIPDAPAAVLVLIRVAGAVLVAAGAAAAAATLYRYAPSRAKAKWTWLTPGTALSALGWLLLSVAFGIYVSRFANYGATYGSIGGVVALLTWVYLSSYIFLFGAELNSEFEHQTAKDTTVRRPAAARRARTPGRPIMSPTARNDEGKDGKACRLPEANRVPATSMVPAPDDDGRTATPIWCRARPAAPRRLRRRREDRDGVVGPVDARAVAAPPQGQGEGRGGTARHRRRPVADSTQGRRLSAAQGLAGSSLCSPARRISAACNFSNARTSIWRMRSRLTL